MIYNVGLGIIDVLDVVSVFSNLLLRLFRNIVPLFIIFMLVYFILVKFFNIREDDR